MAPTPTEVTTIAVPEMPLGSSLLSVAESSTNSMGGEARSTFTGLCTLLSSCMKTPANLEKLLDVDFFKRASGSRLDLDQSPASEGLAGHLPYAVKKSATRM